MEKLKREFENSVNCHTGNSTRRPPNQNKQEAQAGTDSYNSKPNQTRLPTPKTSKADHQLAEFAKIMAEFAPKPTANRRDDDEKKALHEEKAENILAPLRAEMRKVLDERDAMKVVLALEEKQLEKQISADKKEPP